MVINVSEETKTIERQHSSVSEKANQVDKNKGCN